MRKPLKIGKKEYKFKKDAIMHYRKILNSYEFGESLNKSDLNDLLDLLTYDFFNYLAESETSEVQNSDIEITNIEDNIENEILINDIKVAKVQFNTKCFEVFYNDNTSQYISYLMIIRNTKYTPEKLFYIACRNAIHKDIRNVKQEYFDKYSIKGKVKCQETNILSYWTELVIDHRQPNTFSVIVDRFKELNKIDLTTIEFTSNEQNQIIFSENYLIDSFKKYHKEKTSLRIVRIECNSSRTGMARLKRTSKDLTIK